MAEGKSQWRQAQVGRGKLHELVDHLTKVRDGLIEHQQELRQQLAEAKQQLKEQEESG